MPILPSPAKAKSIVSSRRRCAGATTGTAIIGVGTTIVIGAGITAGTAGIGAGTGIGIAATGTAAIGNGAAAYLVSIRFC